MTRQTRRALLAATGTVLTGVLAGCSGLNPLSDEQTYEYDESALSTLPGEVPSVPAAVPLQPPPAHLEAARDRIRSLLADVEPARIPNEVVRDELAHEADSARSALARDERAESTRVDDLAGLTHPRSEAMFVNAGLAAFDGGLTAADVVSRRERHHREAEAFLRDYQYAGPLDDPVGALAEHAQIVEWGHKWAFERLYQYVEYKAQLRGIDVEQVDPENTSRRCSHCGFTHPDNRENESFECLKCSYQNHADYNAAKNIGLRYLRRNQTGDGGGAPVGVRLNSGMLNANGEYTSPADESARAGVHAESPPL